MKLKSNQKWRRCEGGSAPSGQEGLTVVITDGSSEESLNVQGKSEDECESDKWLGSGGCRG